MSKLAAWVEEIEAGPAPEAVHALLSAVLGGERVSLEVGESPLFAALDLALARGDALDPSTLGMAADLARDVVRYYDRLHLPAPEDDTAWLWHTVAARVAFRLGSPRQGWDYAARVLRGRPDLADHLGGVDRAPGFAEWSARCPVHFPWSRRGERLHLALPAPEERPHTHAIASTMEVDGLFTLAAHAMSEASLPAPALQLLSTHEDLVALARLWGTRPEELVGQVWRSHLDDPGEALALLLTEVRQERLERVATALARAVARDFGEADLSAILSGHSLALAQALVSVANGGEVAVNESLVEALDALAGHLSRGQVEVMLSEGYPFDEPGCVLSFVQGSRCFHLAVSHAGRVGATEVGPV